MDKCSYAKRNGIMNPEYMLPGWKRAAFFFVSLITKIPITSHNKK
jgi:hypothetical protein